jgi:membrane fusion protein, multidrug efflux system
VSMRKVDVSRDETGIQVTAGLEAGTRIVTAGIHSLTQGQHIRIDQDKTS